MFISVVSRFLFSALFSLCNTHYAVFFNTRFFNELELIVFFFFYQNFDLMAIFGADAVATHFQNSCNSGSKNGH